MTNLSCKLPVEICWNKYPLLLCIYTYAGLDKNTCQGHDPDKFHGRQCILPHHTQWKIKSKALLCPSSFTYCSQGIKSPQESPQSHLIQAAVTLDETLQSTFLTANL